MKKPITYPITSEAGKIIGADGSRLRDCFDSMQEFQDFIVATINAAAPKPVSLERPPRPTRFHPAILAPYGCMDPHPVANIITAHIERCAKGG